MIVPEVHERHGATETDVGGRRVVADYGRPARTHQAVRNGVGVTEHPYDVLSVEGDDRHAFVDDAVSNRVPEADGRATYALLLDPQGGVETDMYVLTATDRLLVLLPAGEGPDLAEEWNSKTFIQDVTVTDVTAELGVFGVHGPQATEKVASVFTEAAPDEPLTFVRGSIRDAGVTVLRADAPTGEEGYLVVCDAADAEATFDSLEHRGLNAAPFGWTTWTTLTLEAGTPLFETELRGQIPNVAGVRNALDFEKGCYVGQEVVSRVENRGRPSRRLVGLAPETVPGAGAAVFDGDEAVGEVTRGVEAPTYGGPAALAFVGFDAEGPFTVRVDGTELPAEPVALPFVKGSERSARLPSY